MILRRAAKALKEQHWATSTVSLARPALDQQIAGAQAVLVSIDSELGN